MSVLERFTRIQRAGYQQHYACKNKSSRVYFNLVVKGPNSKSYRTRMWANAQRDGRHAEYRWRPLLECHAVTLPRRETR